MMKKGNASLHVIAGGEGMPAEPDWSAMHQDALEQQLAHEHWTHIVGVLRDMDALAVANGHSVRRLVTFRVLYDIAERNVLERGMMLKAKKTGTPYPNPHFTKMRQCDEAIRMLEAELCIAPMRRGRAGKIARKVRKARPADAYLGKAANKQ